MVSIVKSPPNPVGNKYLLGGVAVLALALIFNSIYLGSIPPGLDRDAAANGLLALKWLRDGIFPFWVPHASAPEALIVWLQALSTALLGPSSVALRSVSAISMSLTALTIYGLGLETDRTRYEPSRFWGALFAGLAFAGSPVVIELGRTGLRATLLPLVSGLFFLALLLALRKQKWTLFALSGILLGLSAYTYLAARFLVVVVAVFLILYCLTSSCHRTTRVGIGLMLVTALLVVTPQLFFFARYPYVFLERAQAVSLLHNPLFEDLGLLRLLALKLSGTFMMFGLQWSGQYNQSARPLMSPIMFTGLLMVVPVVWRRWREPGLLLMSVALPVMLLPDLIAGDRLAPHELRVIGSYVPAFVLSGMGLASTIYWLQARFHRNFISWLAPLVAVVLVVWPATDWWLNVAPRLSHSDYEWYSQREIALADLILNTASPLLIPLSEYSRPVVTYLSSDRVNNLSSGLDKDGRLRIPQSGSATLYWPKDAERPRIESVSYLFDPHSLIFVDEDRAYLMPPAQGDVGSVKESCDRSPVNNANGESIGEICEVELGLLRFGDDKLAPYWEIGQLFEDTYFLSGVSVDQRNLEPNTKLGITSYWNLKQRGDSSLRYFVHLLDDRQQMIAGEDLLPGYGVYETDVWNTDETIPVRQLVRLPEKLDPGRYWIEIGLYDPLSGERSQVTTQAGNASNRVLVGPLKAPLDVSQELSGHTQIQARFDEQILLDGFLLQLEDQNLAVSLRMHSLAVPDTDYTFFVHLVDDTDTLVAQADVQPLGGTYPTGIWDADETVIVNADILIPDSVSNGEYTVWMGVYDANTGERLPIVADESVTGQAVTDQNRIKLETFNIP